MSPSKPHTRLSYAALVALVALAMLCTTAPTSAPTSVPAVNLTLDEAEATVRAAVKMEMFPTIVETHISFAIMAITLVAVILYSLGACCVVLIASCTT